MKRFILTPLSKVPILLVVVVVFVAFFVILATLPTVFGPVVN